MDQGIRRAMIFAAGLGTRLRPITDTLPKALVPINGRPLLGIAIEKLKRFGIKEIVINVHHFADQIEAYLAHQRNFDIDIIISDERSKLLETGGGLKKAKAHLDQGDFLVYNADIISDLKLDAMMAYHQQFRPIATLAIRKRETSRYLLFDEQYELVGWRNLKTGEQKQCRPKSLLAPFGFSGIHIIHPRLFDYFPEEEKKFSIIDTYLLAAKQEKIKGYRHSQGLWLDVGKPEQLAKAEQVLKLP